MKKVILFCLLLMAAAGMQAQSLNGTWKVDQEFKNQFGMTGDGGTDIDILLVFQGSNIETKMHLQGNDPEVGVIKMSFTVPGTFKKSGETYTAAFDKEKAEFKVEDIEPTTPEMKEVMKDAESKKLFLNMVQSMLEKGDNNDLKQLLQMADIFKKFEVVSVDAQKLILIVGDEMSIGLDRQ